MAKKKKSKQVSTKEVAVKLPLIPQMEVNSDYGGLPERDLKKNLGCG